MTRSATAREVALDILIAVEEHRAYSNLLLNDALKKANLSPRDRGLLTELVYGTIQRRNTLDWILNGLVKKGVPSLEMWVRQLLRMGVYQLRYLDRIPPRAAVHETVQIAKRKGHKGIAGLVNGVLRSYLRRKEEWKLPDSPSTVKERALLTSHPEWMVKRFWEVYGPEEAEALLRANNRPPLVSLRINPLKVGRDELIRYLSGEYPEAGIRPSEISPQGIVFRGGGNPALHPKHREGWFTIQDESSMLVAEVVDPRPGQRGWDACAAPGGKTTHLAERMEDNGYLLACDIHPHKVQLIEEQVRRLGLTVVEAIQADARELPGTGREPFDFVLLDAPCSGLGVIRRKPDIKWSKKPSEVEALVRLQRQLLESAARMVAPGGVLVYSTCTMEPRENEEQVEHFLRQHPEFEADGGLADKLPPVVRKRVISGKGWIQILPHHFDSDGFFIARMIRKG